ncbi:MAG TPA: hypothetical protein ENJ06_05415 [Phycisphaeraceae bacterium]|nr:hypothetical protein [Phycisphaeraceae bacterium]
MAKKTTGKKTSRKKVVRKKAVTRKPAKKTTKKSSGSVADLEKMLKAKLVARRKELMAELKDIDSKLESFGVASKAAPAAKKSPGRPRKSPGRPAKKSPGRPRNTGASSGRQGSMPNAVLDALKKGEMTVDQLIAKVGKLTSSSNKRAIVSQAINTLLKRGHIKRVSRGVYKAK